VWEAGGFAKNNLVSSDSYKQTQKGYPTYQKREKAIQTVKIGDTTYPTDLSF